MMAEVKKTIKRSKLLSFLLFKIQVMLRGFKNIDTSEVDLFDYKKLAMNNRFCPLDRIIDNNYFGINFCLRRFSKNNREILLYIEHGLFLGSLVKEDSIHIGNAIITFSDYREKQISAKTNKDVHKIGPYIAYAEELYDKSSFQVQKKKLGKTLLVFPSHSTKAVSISIDTVQFTEVIEDTKKKGGFQSVVVCLFYIDIQNGYDKPYIESGYKVFCAGHRMDKLFLDRLKTVISLSDFVLSNDVGTHVGYVHYMKKPQAIYPQNIEICAKDQTAYTREVSQRDDVAWSTFEEIKASIISDYIFNTDSFNYEEIKESKLTEYIWGFEHVKNKREIKAVIDDNI
ncbi:hypothetical protein PC2016_0449 [Pseudoalteromonas carrageenovora]|uniref:Uncharacterized protein n=1 Tax=Pseudoalteromonas carrageenovora IAM 12662 TaxID=1314868 RepID=A0A2K4X5Z6_PSEVC|nr:hypothetical protein [Pseudoalteromonas carrageenovora]MBE0381950.1 hypothetical protein [Pseudoalteromonas carrageenovora IAM 12662]QBJ70694.1 hypothetical protein PC2016_0449 [Pseudoalteromonas carrageenovora]GEB69749.1 hypothetical protein PCA01_04590 [Pseudoalteromonas carrageenovora]SOU39758.1 conserved protein of unknown function [Pseudoalteromonas carrageenovora IAM 12662]